MISQRLKQLRAEKNLTQTDLADILGIAKTTLAAYEQEKSEPSIKTLLKLSEYFDVSVDYLIGKTNCAHEENQPITNLLGIDEKTIEILQKLSSSIHAPNHMDYLEAIIQHPQFEALLSHINSYIINDEKGWKNTTVYNQNGTVANIISADVLKASSMQVILITFKGIVEGIPYSPHFVRKPPTTE